MNDVPPHGMDGNVGQMEALPTEQNIVLALPIYPSFPMASRFSMIVEFLSKPSKKL